MDGGRGGGGGVGTFLYKVYTTGYDNFIRIRTRYFHQPCTGIDGVPQGWVSSQNRV